MREDTWNGVGLWRIELAEDLLVKFITISKEQTASILEEDEHSDEPQAKD